MQLYPLSTVMQDVRVGAALPFNVHDANRTLLLARGKLLETQEQMDTLLLRGAMVNVNELKRPMAETHDAPPHEVLPALWQRSLARLGVVIKTATPRNFASALDSAAKPVLALIERDPDFAVFHIVRQDMSGRAEYGPSHSLHAAIASQLAAMRLGWDKSRRQRLFKAALTMNLAILELQGRLATQLPPLTPMQRATIHAHPMRSVEMLQEAGINDPEWLDAVANHHETPDGSGYPRNVQEVGELALLLRRADVYTAKLSPRATRSALSANVAARLMFIADRDNPMTAALIKELGLYPPGTCVRLRNGELGIAVKRGDTATTPIVAVLTDRRGDTMLEPVRRNTAIAAHTIVAVVNENSLRVRITPEKFFTLG